MYCPYCERPLSAVNANRIHVKNKGKTIAESIAYSCPHCSKVLSIERVSLSQSRSRSSSKENPAN